MWRKIKKNQTGDPFLYRVLHVLLMPLTFSVYYGDDFYKAIFFFCSCRCKVRVVRGKKIMSGYFATNMYSIAPFSQSRNPAYYDDGPGHIRF